MPSGQIVLNMVRHQVPSLWTGLKVVLVKQQISLSVLLFYLKG